MWNRWVLNVKFNQPKRCTIKMYSGITVIRTINNVYL